MRMPAREPPTAVVVEAKLKQSSAVDRACPLAQIVVRERPLDDPVFRVREMRTPSVVADLDIRLDRAPLRQQIGPAHDQAGAGRLRHRSANVAPEVPVMLNLLRERTD